MYRTSCFFVLLLSLVAIAGCRSGSEPPASTQAGGASESNAPASPWKIELRTTPERPRMVKPVSFTVHLLDGRGRAVDNAEVRGSLVMKTMDMGRTELQFAPKGNGDYEAILKEMEMSGPWELAVHASQGSFHAQKTFELVIYD